MVVFWLICHYGACLNLLWLVVIISPDGIGCVAVRNPSSWVSSEPHLAYQNPRLVSKQTKLRYKSIYVWLTSRSLLSSDLMLWFPNWNSSPQKVIEQYNAACCSCCAQHMCLGLVYWGPMFYLACVKDGCVWMHAPLCHKGTHHCV